MIAAAGLRQYRRGLTGGVELNADPALPLGDHRPS
jgi:hypothetical protein